ncbi:hypothetical protein CVT25_004098 [Psilocybe cyanescens]|uniref:Uncharacterized protein n=1 Tax=Psilocybe cyanescens TaxID=93625 RepID=A0A409X8X3_PSICY|nr:hypothetical protein CVT25_004098 [Psilocybe cyanescens]
MKFLSSSVALAALCVSSTLAALTINTPVDAIGGALIANLGVHSAHSAVWTTNVAPGTVVIFKVEDNAGAVAQSAPVTVEA